MGTAGSLFRPVPFSSLHEQRGGRLPEGLGHHRPQDISSPVVRCSVWSARVTTCTRDERPWLLGPAALTVKPIPGARMAGMRQQW